MQALGVTSKSTLPHNEREVPASWMGRLGPFALFERYTTIWDEGVSVFTQCEDVQNQLVPFLEGKVM